MAPRPGVPAGGGGCRGRELDGNMDFYVREIRGFSQRVEKKMRLCVEWRNYYIRFSIFIYIKAGADHFFQGP